MRREGVIIILAALMLQGCGFSRVGFKYGSFHHVPPSESMTSIGIPPTDLAMLLSRGLRQEGAVIVDRRKINTVIDIPADALACWSATKEVVDAEFESYRRDDFGLFSNIDRDTPFVKRHVVNNCQIISQHNDNDIEESWYLAVDLHDRNPTVNLTTYNDLVLTDGKKLIVGGVESSGESININIYSRLKFWIWRKKGDNRTSVYVEGIPVSGGLEAKNGNSIGYLWWQHITGYEESRLVRNYLALLSEMDYLQGERKAKDSKLSGPPILGGNF